MVGQGKMKTWCREGEIAITVVGDLGCNEPLRSKVKQRNRDALKRIEYTYLQQYGVSAADADADAVSCALRRGSPRIGIEKAMGADQGATWRIDDVAVGTSQEEQRNPPYASWNPIRVSLPLALCSAGSALFVCIPTPPILHSRSVLRNHVVLDFF
jgi:hypothetical protein